MGFALFSVGSLATALLAHALYSGWEHSTASQPLVSSFHSISTASSTPLPLDIALEGLVGLVFLIISVIFSGSPLKPTNWAVWAEQVQKDEVRLPSQRRMGNGQEGAVGTAHPFAYLEDRKGFVDIRALRKGFTEWINLEAMRE